MKLILYPLIILMFVGAFNMLVNSQTQFDYSYSGLHFYTSQGNQTLDADTYHLQQQTSSTIFNINMVTGLIALIIALVVVGVLAGIKVLGSGLSNYSVQLVHKSAVYYGLWGIFSAFSFSAFAIIPLFGIFIWFGLTLVYTIGFFQTLGSSGGDDD